MRPACALWQDAARVSAFVSEHSSYVKMPLATPAAIADLLANKHLAGYQKPKDRGTIQYEQLKQLIKSGGPFGKWLARCIKVAKGKGKLVNVFLNMNSNSGEAGVEYGDGAGAKVWHVRRRGIKHHVTVAMSPSLSRTGLPALALCCP